VSLVSVIIPAFNAADTIGETLSCVANQTHRELEILVVDDGSTDGTVEIAASIQDPRLRIESIPNAGVSAARNQGVMETAGEYVAFLDADDLWLPTKLERQIEMLEATSEAGLSVTAATRVNAAARPLEHMPVWEGEDPCEALLLHSMVIGCISSGVVRRSVLERAGGFDQQLSQSADWDLWLRLARTTKFAVIDEPLVLYRSHPQSMSRDIALLEFDTFRVLDKFFADPESVPWSHLRARAYGTHWMVCSGSYLHAAQLRSSVRCLMRGMQADPGSIRRPLGLPWRRAARSRPKVSGLS
jgi:glycosyltransferase involved in cell wall biosynthesis